MKLMTESIYIGHDMKRFNEIRDALDAGNFAAYKKMRLEGFEEGKINGNR